jgi:hypothetical protein
MTGSSKFTKLATGEMVCSFQLAASMGAVGGDLARGELVPAWRAGERRVRIRGHPDLRRVMGEMIFMAVWVSH